MPNDLVRSVSAFFNRSQRERKSDRRQQRPEISIRTQNNPIVNKPEIEFNDDYVDPLDMINDGSRNGKYDDPWSNSIERIPNQDNYDAPWSVSSSPKKGMTYDEPWDRGGLPNSDCFGSTNGTISSEAGKTSSSSNSGCSYRVRDDECREFKPDPRLILDPLRNKTESSISTAQPIIKSPEMPHRRARSLIPPRHVPQQRFEFPDTSIRPAKSYESIPIGQNGTVPPTPGVMESPLTWQKRNLPTNAPASQYLKQLTQANDNNTNSLDDLLYGKNKNMYDSPWANQQLINPHQSTMGSSNGHPKADVMHRLNDSISSQSTQGSSVDHSMAQSVLILDQMDYYRASMTRNEAEKILHGEPVGSFLVRRNTSNPVWFSLSVMTEEQGVLHLVISDEENQSGRVGWHIGGFTNYSNEFSTVPELINFYYCNYLNIKGTKGLLLVKHSAQKDR